MKLNLYENAVKYDNKVMNPEQLLSYPMQLTILMVLSMFILL